MYQFKLLNILYILKVKILHRQIITKEKVSHNIVHGITKLNTNTQHYDFIFTSDTLLEVGIGISNKDKLFIFLL